MRSQHIRENVRETRRDERGLFGFIAKRDAPLYTPPKA